LLIYFLGASVQAQSQDDTPEEKCQDGNSLEITHQKLQCVGLELSHRARIGRAFQYQLGLAEQFGARDEWGSRFRVMKARFSRWCVG
jgi:hypothetical protein